MTGTSTATLAEWLLEQVAEDEQVARKTGEDPVDSEHQARWPPARVLAECEAKRRIIGMCRSAVAAVAQGSVSSRNRVADETAVDVLGSVLQEYGVAYAAAGRAGYRPEWRPE